MYLTIYEKWWPYCWNLSMLKSIYTPQASMHPLFGKRHLPADSGGGLRLLQNKKIIEIQLNPLKDPKLVIIRSVDAIAMVISQWQVQC